MTTGAVTVDGRARVLADGSQMPMLGLGVWQVPDGADACGPCAGRWSLDTGISIRRRSTATRKASGGLCATAASPATGLHHDQVHSGTDPATEAERSLRAARRRLRRPVPRALAAAGPTWAWPGMERARALGYARSIGVSNFSVSELETLMAEAAVAPAVNQVQFSPFKYRRALLDACQQRSRGLRPTARWGPAGTSPAKAVSQVARRIGRTPAQVLLRWCLQHEVPVIPKSTHRERIEENAQIFDFALSPEIWQSSTHWTRRTAPTAPSNANGGDAASRRWSCTAYCARSRAWPQASTSGGLMTQARISGLPAWLPQPWSSGD